MKKKLNVLILIHPQLNPLAKGLTRSKGVDSPCKTEAHVYSTLKSLGHIPEFLELEENLDPLMERVNQGRVDLVFNLLEELGGESKFDFHAVSYLESRGISFTGCGPRSLILTRDKALAKIFVQSKGVMTPKFSLVNSLKELSKKRVDFPAFVKFNSEDASLGLKQTNRVENFEKLKMTYKRLSKLSDAPILVEEFIPGSDVSVALIGNRKLTVLPARVLSMPDKNWVAGENVKFKSQLRSRHGIRSQRIQWSDPKEQQRFENLAKSIYLDVGLRGYGRLDFRMKNTGEFYFLEANANPNLAKDEDLGMSAKAIGMSYPELISKIVELSYLG